MIDATKGPVPAWKRYGTVALLGLFIAVAVWVLWTKELHHSSSTASPTPSVSTSVPTRGAPVRRIATPATTIPGGIPISNRDPFTG